MSDASEQVLTRLGRLHPKRIDNVDSNTLSLDRIERLLAALGNPQDKLARVIHVAGTNGKGSTVATLRACLEAAGYRVHAYTSPHLVRFNERIRVAGQLIDDAALAALLDEVERGNAGAEITFFEITTAAAFLAFSRQKADFALLEVGLGGRLDTTNVVRHPAVTAITPVSLDHQAFLGPTIAAIAAEKAGILKPGAPAVIGPQTEEARRGSRPAPLRSARHSTAGGASGAATPSAAACAMKAGAGRWTCRCPRCRARTRSPMREPRSPASNSLRAVSSRRRRSPTGCAASTGQRDCSV